MATAYQTVASLDDILDRMHLPIAKCMVLSDKDPVLSLLNKVADHKIYGKSLEMNMPFKITAGGTFGRGAEQGAIPAGTPSTSEEGQTAPVKLWAMVMDFTHETLLGMSGGRKKLRTSLEEELQDALRKWKERRAAIFGGQRGDGVVGRLNGAATSGSAILTMDRPFTAVVGDDLLSYYLRDTNDTTGNGVTTAVSVTKVDHLNNQMTISLAQTIDDEQVFTYANGRITQASAKQRWPMGIPGHVDDVGLGTSNWYDTGDSTAHDHVDTYMALARSSYTTLNSQSIDAGGAAIDEFWLSRPALSVMYQGATPEKLVYYMHPDMYSRIVRYFAGLTPRSEKIKLPGGDLTLPIITGIPGVGRVPVVTSFYINDGAILCLQMGDFEQATAGGDWVMQGGTRALLIPDGSGSYIDGNRYAYRAYWNTVCRKPYLQSALYNLDTTN